MAKSRAAFDHSHGPSSQTIDPGRRPAAHLAELLMIAFVPLLSEPFDLRPIEPPDMGLIRVAAAVWTFLARWAWGQCLLGRFLGTNPAR